MHQSLQLGLVPQPSTSHRYSSFDDSPSIPRENTELGEGTLLNFLAPLHSSDD